MTAEVNKTWVLTNFSDFVGLLDMAHGGEDLSPDDRIFYTSQLALCARIFRAIYMDVPSNELALYVDLLSKINNFSARPDERGEIVKEGWVSIQPIVEQYIFAIE